MHIISCLDFKASLRALLSNYHIDFQTIIFGFRCCRLTGLISFTNCLEEAFEVGYMMHTNGQSSHSVRRDSFLHLTNTPGCCCFYPLIFKLDTQSILLHHQTLQNHLN